MFLPEPGVSLSVEVKPKEWLRWSANAVLLVSSSRVQFSWAGLAGRDYYD